MTREQRDSSAIGEVESAYHALEKLGLPVPDRGDSPDKHFMHAFHYLGVVAPLIRDGHIEKARELAAEAIRSLNASEGKPPT